MLERYERIEIPLAHAQEFEKVVANFGGVFARKRLAPKSPAALQDTRRQETAQEWSKQRAMAKALVDRFKDGGNQEPTAIKNKGLRGLISDTFQYDLSLGKTLKQGIYPFKVKETLNAIFDESLPEEIPDDLVLGGHNTFRYMVIGDFLVPRRIIFLIQKYGLDGQRRTFEGVAAENGVTLSVAKRVVGNALTDLSRNRRIRELVLN